MGATIELLAHETGRFPRLIPTPMTPVQNNNQLIAGTQRAVLIDVLGESFWLKKNMPVTLKVDGEEIKLELSNEKMILPFEFTLSEFKMDTDPGTRNPASYESFVNLFTIDGNEKHHVFMNNPLKYADFTFYQASYFQDANQNYGSVLSVNYDPGRFWKYLGSILLVFGSTWHFWINRKKRKV